MMSPSELCVQKETNKLKIHEPQREMMGKSLLMNGKKLAHEKNGSGYGHVLTWMVLRAGLLSLVSRALILLRLSCSFAGLGLAAVALPPGWEDVTSAAVAGEASRSISRSMGTK